MFTLSENWNVLPNGLVQARRVGRVAWLKLDNPPANGYSTEMMGDLDSAILASRFDEEVDVLVVTGGGDKFFCSGADIGMLGIITPRVKYNFCLLANETMLRLEHTAKPVIAALNGHCVGGGLEIALACDLRVARESAEGKKEFCFGLPEVALGVLPGTGGTQRLARLLGKAKAFELMAEGELFGTQRAVELGVVHKVFGHEDFESQVQAYAEEFCAPNRAPMAVGHIKRAVQTGTDLSLEAGLALERELQQRLFESEDAQEGIAAFKEKRPPKFTGN